MTPIAYAGFWRRFLAWCIDAPLRFVLGLAFVFLPMRVLVSGQAARYGTTDSAVLWRNMPLHEELIVILLWLCATVFVPWLYTAFMESSPSGATFGKRLLGIRVTDANIRQVSFGRASGRYFASLIPTLGIAYLLIPFTQRQQALPDLIANCLVIRTHPKSIATTS